MIENSDENRSKLAQEIADSWDIGTLMEYAVGKLEDHYEESDSDFQSDWQAEFNDNDLPPVQEGEIQEGEIQKEKFVPSQYEGGTD